MGMAASQARLLFITSRQNDVSAKMQRISNQNMVLARDSEEVAEKYNRMLSSAKSNSASFLLAFKIANKIIIKTSAIITYSILITIIIIYY